MSFKDHFSKQAADYAKFRPHYPPALFDWLAQQAPSRDLAWDAGTGSGQVAVELAQLFERVVATDPSANQINNAEAHARVEYRVEPAERSSFEPATVDLITVAQALHWFDFPAFYAEAERVLKPGGVLAAWCYGLFRTGSEADAVLDLFYTEMVGPYWPSERKLVEEGYRTVPFPSPKPQRRNSPWKRSGTWTTCWATSAPGRRCRATGKPRAATRWRKSANGWRRPGVLLKPRKQ